MTDRLVCSRCGTQKWANRRLSMTWNVIFRQGHVVGMVCPECQTPEENSEAEVNLATTDVFQGPDGRGYWRPKV